jgi:cell division protein FtsQ
MKKNILFWVFFVVAIIFATYFSVRIIMTVMGKTTIVKSVSVSSSGDFDRSVIGNFVTPGMRSYSVSLEGLNARAMALPVVEDSAVRRMANGNLSVKIKTFSAVAVWTDGDLFYPMTANGTKVNDPMDLRPDNMFVFRGNMPKDVSDIVKSLRSNSGLEGDIKFVEMVENRRWNLITNDGAVIKLPENNTDTAIANLSKMNKGNNIMSREFQILDMRDDARILIKQ